MIRDDPIHGRNETRPASRTLATQNTNGNNGCLFGNTIFGSGDCSGNVSSVTVAVSTLQVLVKHVDAGFDATGKVGVTRHNSGVNDIDANARSGRSRIVVGAVISCVGLINSIETPRRSRVLRIHQRHWLVCNNLNHV